jgi:hypothetical protein
VNVYIELLSRKIKCAPQPLAKLAVATVTQYS